MALNLRIPTFQFIRQPVRYKYMYNIFSSKSTTKDVPAGWNEAKPFKEMPSLRRLPVIGTAWQSMPIIGKFDLEHQHVANREKRKLLGNIFKEKFGSLNVVLCFEVSHYDDLMNAEGNQPYRTEFATLKAYRESRREYYDSNGLLAVNGAEWKDLRFKSQKHILRPSAAKSYIEDMHTIAVEFASRIGQITNNDNEIQDLMIELYKWSLEAVASVGLNTRLGCLKSNIHPDSDAMKVIESVMTQFECMNKLEPITGNIPIWKLFPTPTWKRFVKASDVYTEIANKYVTKGCETIHDKNSKSFLTNLFQEGMSKSSIMVMVSDLLMAGIETTSHAMGFLLYHLATHPEQQSKLHEEITRLLPSKDDKITEDVYTQLKYSKLCLKESLRLKPVVGGSARIMTRDAVIGGYQVPEGTVVAVGFQEIFTDEKVHENPLSFRPERWQEPYTRLQTLSALAFGCGIRSCIGKRIAEIEIHCLIAEIIRRFELKYEGEEIGLITKLVSLPDRPLKIKFIERSSA